jgi:RNA polymerase sigma-70 factor (family 1)
MDAEKNGKSWFKNIFNQNYTYVLNYLFYLSGDADLSEDLTQDVFLQLWNKRHIVKEETLRPYLFTIAKHSFLKNIRRKNYDLKFRSGFIESIEHESPEYILELKEFDKQLQKSLACLPDKCRVVFLMNRIDGLSYREIAENTGVSIKAVEKQMSKALAILREKLGGNI